MKVLIVSDIHNRNDIAKVIHDLQNPDLVLDCGDHENIENLFGYTHHLFIEGNHEPDTIKLGANDFPLPFRVNTSQTVRFEFLLGESLRISGISGNYSSSDGGRYVNNSDVFSLRKLPERSIDVLLLHESPLNVPKESPYYDTSKAVLNQIFRIKPKFVFSGHTGVYAVKEFRDGPAFICLDEITKGYGLLEYDYSKGKTLVFRRIKSAFA